MTYRARPCSRDALTLTDVQLEKTTESTSGKDRAHATLDSLVQYLQKDNTIHTGSLVILFRHMAAAARMNVPVSDVLQVQAAGIRRGRAVLLDVQRRIHDGVGIADALAVHPGTFSPVVVQLVRAGEHTGMMSDAFLRCASQLRSEAKTRQRIRAAVLYPLLVLLLAALGGIYLCLRVLPAIAGMFNHMQLDLPPVTRFILANSQAISAHVPAVLIFVMVIVGCATCLVRTLRGQILLHRALLSLPVVRNVIQHTVASRFAHTLADGFASRVPLAEALQLAAESTGNPYIVQRLAAAIPQIKAGEDLAEVLHETQALPDMLIRALNISERTASLEEVLREAAALYAHHARESLRSAISLIEPLMVMCAAAVIGIIAYAVVLPMYSTIGGLG